MGRILMVHDGAGSREVLLAALRQAYANMRVSEESKGGVIVIDTLGTFKETEQMRYIEPLRMILRSVEDMKGYMDPWALRKDFSRSMFLTDARSSRPSHRGRKKKVNRLRVKKRVKARHRRK